MIINRAIFSQTDFHFLCQQRRKVHRCIDQTLLPHVCRSTRHVLSMSAVGSLSRLQYNSGSRLFEKILAYEHYFVLYKCISLKETNVIMLILSYLQQRTSQGLIYEIWNVLSFNCNPTNGITLSKWCWHCLVWCHTLFGQGWSQNHFLWIQYR